MYDGQLDAERRGTFLSNAMSGCEGLVVDVPPHLQALQ